MSKSLTVPTGFSAGGSGTPGPQGPAGATGPAGPAGPTGPTPTNVLLDGAGGVLQSEHLWSRDAYRTNVAHTVLPAATPTKVFTAPAGYIALVGGTGLINSTGASIVGAAYVMADAVTTPTIADRFLVPTATTGETTFGPVVVLDEGWSLWLSMASAGVTAIVTLALIPKTGDAGVLTPVMIKDPPVASDTLVYECDGAGRTAYPLMGYQHVRGVASVTITAKLHRASDGATLTVGARTQGAAGSANWLGGLLQASSVLLDGDSLTVNPSAAGLNINVLYLERDIAG